MRGLNDSAVEVSDHSAMAGFTHGTSEIKGQSSELFITFTTLVQIHLFTSLETLSCSLLLIWLVQDVEFVRTGYGKNAVKVMVVRRLGSRHDIVQLKADVQLTLKSRKDYITGDNSDIIPTDTIKNTVHGLAKLKGVS